MKEKREELLSSYKNSMKETFQFLRQLKFLVHTRIFQAHLLLIFNRDELSWKPGFMLDVSAQAQGCANQK